MRWSWIAGAVLVGCHAAAPPARPSDPTPVWGTAHPYYIVNLPPDGRWVVLCQARSDSNRDGRIEVDYSIHGDDDGDVLSPYLIDDRGHEQPIRSVLAADPTGRWLVIVED